MKTASVVSRREQVIPQINAVTMNRSPSRSIEFDWTTSISPRPSQRPQTVDGVDGIGDVDSSGGWLRSVRQLADDARVKPAKMCQFGGFPAGKHMAVKCSMGWSLQRSAGASVKCDLFADLGKNGKDKGASGPRIYPCSVLQKRHIEIRAPGVLQGRTAVA